MHQTIYAVVDAQTNDEALDRAKAAFDRLVGLNRGAASIFECYMLAEDDEPGTPVDVIPGPAQLYTDAGADLLVDAWEATLEEFMRNLERVRETIDELSTQEFLRNEDLVRHACFNLGAYRGPSVFLYDETGNGIRHRQQLHAMLDTCGEAWIVPAVVYY